MENSSKDEVNKFIESILDSVVTSMPLIPKFTKELYEENEILNLHETEKVTHKNEYHEANKFIESILDSNITSMPKLPKFAKNLFKENEILKYEFENSNLEGQTYKYYTKLWKHRYELFSKYDEGIIIESKESWYSVTPEKVAVDIASNILKYCNYDENMIILDGFCGVGGNTIQFAKLFKKVIAIDIDPQRIGKYLLLAFIKWQFCPIEICRNGQTF